MQKLKDNLLSIISLSVAIIFLFIAFLVPEYSKAVTNPGNTPQDTAVDYDGTSKIISGTESWLFRAYGPSSSEYEDFTGTNLFSEAELSTIAAKLMKERETLSYNDCESYFVFVPSKISVYSSLLPSNISGNKATERRYTQLYNYLKTKTDLKLTDVSAEFDSLSNTNQLYDNADDTLNDIGGFYLYNSVASALNADIQSGLKYHSALWNEYLLTLKYDDSTALSKEYKDQTGTIIQNRTFTMNEKYVPYTDLEFGQDDIKATQIAYKDRESGCRYNSVIIYNTGRMSAVRKYFSAFTAKTVYCDTVTVDESVIDKACPNIAVFLIGEDNLAQLSTGGGAIIGDDSEKSATPVIIATTYSDYDKMVVFGSVEKHTTISVRGAAQSDTCRTEDGSFVMEFTIKDEDTSVIRLTAKTDGKAESEPRKITAELNYDNGYRNVIIGKDGHLHYTETMNDYLGNNLYSKDALAGMKEYLTHKAEVIRSVSPKTKIIYIIAPNHLTIYPETAPDWLAQQKQTDNSRLQQIYDYFKDFEDVKFINVRDRLLAEKEKTDFLIYNKTDTHWNEFGAYFACCEVLDYVAKDFPAAAPDSLDKFTVVSKSVTGGDMANFLRVDLTKVREYGTFVRSKTPLKTGIEKQYIMDFENAQFGAPQDFNIGGEGLPTMIMYRDSFTTNMVSFLSEKFSRSIYRQISEYELDLEQIAEVQPDYVIFEFVERNLGGLS